MEMINAEEKAEMRRLAGSASLKEDLRLLSARRYNPLIVDGEVSMDRLLDFLNDFNEFINHEPREFKPIIDREMKL